MTFIMVVELSGVHFSLKSYAWFQKKSEPALRARSVWNHKYDFRPKLHDTKFNYHFIAPILKSQFFANFNIHVSTSGNPVFKTRNRKGCYINYANDHVMWQNSLVCRRKQFFSLSKLLRGWPDFFSLATSVFLMLWFVIFLLVVRQEALDFIMVPIVF